MPPSFNERRISDKPWAHLVPRLHDAEVAKLSRLVQQERATLEAVDLLVQRLVSLLGAKGELDNTVFVFTSDNGIMRGEHRLLGKEWPYEESIRVPLVMRTPWIREARTDSHLVLNLDFASTLAQLASVEPGLPQDGRSLVPLLMPEPANPPWRDSFLVEWLGIQRAPKGPVDFEAVRTMRYLYVEYRNGWRELYDLKTDPYELANLADAPASSSLLSDLHAELERLLAGTSGQTPSP